MGGSIDLQAELYIDNYPTQVSQRNLDADEFFEPGIPHTRPLPVRNPFDRVATINLAVEPRLPGWMFEISPTILPNMDPFGVQAVMLTVIPPAELPPEELILADILAFDEQQIIVGGIRKIYRPPIWPHPSQDPIYAERELSIQPYPVLASAPTMIGAEIRNPGPFTQTFNVQFSVSPFVVELAAGRIPVIASTGANSTTEAIELTRCAKAAGADACLLVTPYYNKPTQEGLYLHHKAVAGAVDVPQILYNVPGRTGCDMLPETVGRLAAVPNIVGVKEATGDLSRVGKIRALAGPGFAIYSGDDATARELILLGGQGVISVTANVAPGPMHRMSMAALAGNRVEGDAIFASRRYARKLVHQQQHVRPGGKRRQHTDSDWQGRNTIDEPMTRGQSCLPH